MKTKMRWLAVAVLLVIAAAACRESLVQPDARPSLDKSGWEIPDNPDIPDDTVNTGYFGSGHYEPDNPPPDTTPQ
ncbi:MAG TPA: hypothetical protein VF142_06455 [Longimicrobium sp.]